jgi:hypothetical protein
MATISFFKKNNYMQSNSCCQIFIDLINIYSNMLQMNDIHFLYF